ncbi:MAG: alkaline phosphatase family protein, partial [Nanoarchaeota archaeon]|nr:alkaline phosphatase family protein [Nanoarchaeota archaeon]
KPDYRNSILQIKELIMNSRSKKTLLILIDGFGYKIFEELLKDRQMKKTLRKFKTKKISSVFPTTTAAAITSIFSGEPPSKHGIYEWHMYSSKIKMEFNPLKFEAVDESMQKKFEKVATPKLIKHRDFTEELQKKKTRVYQIIPYEIVGSNFNPKKSKFIGYRNTVEAIVKTKHAIKNENRKSFFYLYLPQYDESEHLNGPYSEESLKLAKEILKLIHEELLSIKGLKFIITADHGCMEVKKEINLEKLSWFWDNVWKNLKPCCKRKILPVGSPRDIFLHVKESKVDYVVEVLRKKLKKYAEVYKTNYLIKEGVFGGIVSKQFRKDIGNVTILPKNGILISFYSEKKAKGFHGGLSEEELFVPLMIM